MLIVCHPPCAAARHAHPADVPVTQRGDGHGAAGVAGLLLRPQRHGLFFVRLRAGRGGAWLPAVSPPAPPRSASQTHQPATTSAELRPQGGKKPEDPQRQGLAELALKAGPGLALCTAQPPGSSPGPPFGVSRELAVLLTHELHRQH